ncbi:MAG: hypothetical protein ACM3VV_05930 [Deltaproteobacteria bacterium]
MESVLLLKKRAMTILSVKGSLQSRRKRIYDNRSQVDSKKKML